LFFFFLMVAFVRVFLLDWYTLIFCVPLSAMFFPSFSFFFFLAPIRFPCRFSSQARLCLTTFLFGHFLTPGPFKVSWWKFRCFGTPPCFPPVFVVHEVLLFPLFCWCGFFLLSERFCRRVVSLVLNSCCCFVFMLWFYLLGASKSVCIFFLP